MKFFLLDTLREKKAEQVFEKILQTLLLEMISDYTGFVVFLWQAKFLTFLAR